VEIRARRELSADDGTQLGLPAPSRAAVEFHRSHHHIVHVFTGVDVTDHTKIHRSDAQLKKLQRAEEGRKAMAEYEAEQAAVRAKTERLRALRLAREAEQAAAKSEPRQAVRKKASPAGKKKTAA
jgi:multidrug efflux pump subunit AcrA (membrane-fusion protein)